MKIVISHPFLPRTYAFYTKKYTYISAVFSRLGYRFFLSLSVEKNLRNDRRVQRAVFLDRISYAILAHFLRCFMPVKFKGVGIQDLKACLALPCLALTVR